MRILKLLLVLVVVGVVGADFLVKQVAENRLGAQLASSLDGVNEAEVTIEAFPFIPALLSGNFDGLRVEVPRVSKNGVRISNVVLDLTDIEFDALEVFLGGGGIGLGGGDGRAHLTGRAITRALREQGTDARVSFRGSEAVVTASGQEVVVDEVELAGDAIAFELPTGPVALDLPTTIDGVSYEAVRVTGGRLVLDLEVSARTLEL